MYFLLQGGNMRKEEKEKWKNIKEDISDFVIKLEKEYPAVFEFLVILLYSFIAMTSIWLALKFILFPLIELLFKISIVLGLIAIASLIAAFAVAFC